jgi:hypothetical protein
MHEGKEVKGIGYNSIIITCQICQKIFIPLMSLEHSYEFWKNNFRKKAFCHAHQEQGTRLVSDEQTRKNKKWEEIEEKRRKSL